MTGKVAIIHDWLNGMRGGEKVLEEILEIFPQADIFTLFLEPDKISDKIKAHKITPSSLNKYRFIRKRYKHFLPFLPSAVESFDLRPYDLVISISHCVAKGVITRPDAIHISYVNSPMRYIWDQYFSYFGDTRGIKKFIIKRQASRLRTWDVASSTRVDHFIGNSCFIKQRIMKYYRREADVVHPPVEVDYFQPAENPTRDFFLTVTALVPYKEVRLLVEAFNHSGDPLVIVGKGPEEKKLKKLAKPNITFKKNVPPNQLKQLFQNATAFVFAGIEDFGIVFVESLACGTPVLAYNKGGVMDIVTHGESGILFHHQTPESIVEGIEKIKKLEFTPSIIRENSLKFSKENFQQEFRRIMNRCLNEI